MVLTCLSVSRCSHYSGQPIYFGLIKTNGWRKWRRIAIFTLTVKELKTQMVWCFRLPLIVENAAHVILFFTLNNRLVRPWYWNWYRAQFLWNCLLTLTVIPNMTSVNDALLITAFVFCFSISNINFFSSVCLIYWFWTCVPSLHTEYNACILHQLCHFFRFYEHHPV